MLKLIWIFLLIPLGSWAQEGKSPYSKIEYEIFYWNSEYRDPESGEIEREYPIKSTAATLTIEDSLISVAGQFSLWVPKKWKIVQAVSKSLGKEQIYFTFDLWDIKEKGPVKFSILMGNLEYDEKVGVNIPDNYSKFEAIFIYRNKIYTFIGIL